MHLPKRLIWPAVMLLVFIGVTTSLVRVVAPTFATAVAVPARSRALESLGIADPLAAERVAQVEEFERKFVEHRSAILWHVVPGGLFLLFAPLQFVRRIRQRHIALHRWSGRILLLLALASFLPAMYFGLLMPTGGRAESVVIALFGALFLLALIRAWRAIRRKEVSRHREWMIRAFAVALGISAVRLYAAPLDLMLTPMGFSSPAIFVVSLWFGFGTTSLLAEYWIFQTRPHAHRAVAVATT